MPIVTNRTQSPQTTTSSAARSGRFTKRGAMAIAAPTLLLGATLAAPAAQASLDPSQSDATQSVTQIDSSSALSSLTNADKGKKVLPTGVNAVKHAAAELEKKAGHKLFDLVVHGDNQVHVHFAESYDLQKDAPALAELSKVAQANGVTLTADR